MTMGISNLRAKLPETGSFAWIMTMMGLASIVLIVAPFVFWYSVWNGEAIREDEIHRAFADPAQPSAAASMLLRMAEKISRRDREMERWYPNIIELSRRPAPGLRRAAAWTMGKDRGSGVFQKRLREMMDDPDLLVRRTAAVSLSAFKDPAARPELLLAIRPHIVRSTLAGSVNLRILPKDSTSPETAIARLGDRWIDAGVFGTVKRLLVKDGDPVSAGQPLVEILPLAEDARDMLRALSDVGLPEDVSTIRQCISDASEEAVRREGESAIRDIERRANASAGVRIQ